MKNLFGRVCATALIAFSAGCGGDDASNARVKSVVVVGSSVTSSIYQDGKYGLTMIPKDEAGHAVLGEGLNVKITITNPPGMFTSRVSSTACGSVSAGDGLAIGVIIDDSGSMSGSDPMLKRKDAAAAFIATLSAKDQVLLSDYGPAGSNLRDLVCAQAGGPSAACSPPTAAGFTSDKAVLTAATAKIVASGGTPLYSSCIQMIPLVAAKAGRRQAILLLSDGQPSDSSKRAKCHADALAAQIPIFTVGLGPAAEVAGTSEPVAVRTLRELSTETKGAYASANAPEQLMVLFSNIGVALTQGKCSSNALFVEYPKLTPGTRIGGTVEVGDNKATGVFEFVAPMKL